MAAADGGRVLGIGIDWAEEFHDVALGTQEKGVIEQFRIDHGPAGITVLIEHALRLEPDPAEIDDDRGGVRGDCEREKEGCEPDALHGDLLRVGTGEAIVVTKRAARNRRLSASAASAEKASGAARCEGP